jgi:hypothetical protein
MESVDDVAQVEQIGESAEVAYCGAVIRRWAAAGVIFTPVGPLCGNERAAAIGKAYEQEQHAAPPNAADDGQSPAFEGMALPDDRHRGRNMTVMGSLWPLPSGVSARNGWSASWNTASATSASSA